jgi:hypothetical protein
MNFAIVMLCMLKDHYVVGACINAFVNRVLLRVNNIDNIELVIMCDDYIYKRHNGMLKKYFDKIVRINLSYYNMMDTDTRKSENWFKKYGWVIYSLSKWQCLKLTEYKKVLLLDIDILPVTHKFYDLFNFDTPAFRLKQSNKKYTEETCINNDRMYDLINDANSYDEYIENAKLSYYSINGGIVLLRPDMDEYKNYIKFVGEIDKNGISQMKNFCIDETTLFYYFSKYKKDKEFYRICMDFMDVPWEDENNKPDKNKIVKSYNYLSFIKPWKKPKFISWDEEHLWRDIYRGCCKTLNMNIMFSE